MIKLKKDYNLKVICIAIGITLFLTNALYSSPFSSGLLRLQPGEQDDTFDRIKILLELQKIFNFFAEREELPSSDTPADLLILFGNDNIRTIYEAARIYNDGLVKNIVVSGFRGTLIKLLIENAQREGYVLEGDLDLISEAEIMKMILMDKGVSEDKIIVEDRSTNTSENANNTKTILEEKGFGNGKLY